MALLCDANLRTGTTTAESLDGRLLAIYLRDHHALLVALSELAQRMRTAQRPDAVQAFADEVRDATDDDRGCVEQYLYQLNSAPSRTRHAAVWTAERLGRLKLNGRLLRPSPLSAVTELEGCRLLLESNRAVWRGLAHLGLGPGNTAERAGRSERLLATAESLRVAALRSATRQPLDEEA
jgi:hypothetical protein